MIGHKRPRRMQVVQYSSMSVLCNLQGIQKENLFLYTHLCRYCVSGNVISGYRMKIPKKNYEVTKPGQLSSSSFLVEMFLGIFIPQSKSVTDMSHRQSHVNMCMYACMFTGFTDLTLHLHITLKDKHTLGYIFILYMQDMLWSHITLL